VPYPADIWECPTVRPLISTHYPGLLHFLCALWLRSARSIVRSAARTATVLALFQFGIPIILDLHPLQLWCFEACSVPGSFLWVEITAAVPLSFFSTATFAAFAGNRPELPPAPIQARGECAAAPFTRPWKHPS
jgi:hypothetical protein